MTLVGSEDAQNRAKEMIDELMDGSDRQQQPEHRNKQGRFERNDDYRQQQRNSSHQSTDNDWGRNNT